jgi:outer membrane protein assembly factor BamB
MMGFVVNASRQKAREDRSRVARESAAAAVMDEPSESDVERRETEQRVMRAIEELPEHYRIPLWMHYREGFSAGDVAAALEIPVKTIQKRLERSIEQLRGTLAASGVSLGTTAVTESVASLTAESAPAALVGKVGVLASKSALAGTMATSAGVGAKSAALTSGGLAMKVTAGVVLAALATGGAFVASSNKAQDHPEVTAAPDKPATEGKGSDKVPIGSPDFYPSDEHPLGWRGDGSGRFPGANPPTEWGRTVKGIFMKLRCEAGKPKEAKESGELLNMGAIRDWLIAGPFSAKDFKSEEEFLKDEPNLVPQADEKAGDKEWKPYHISVENQSQSTGHLVLDLALHFGMKESQEWQNHPGKMEPVCAYAQTSIWSPDAGKVRLRFEGGSSRKAWFNGTPVKMPGQYEGSPVVDVKAGWNNLVVKALSTKGAWNFTAVFSPVGPYEYETKNIVWMTPMPGQSWCSPIVVGERVFIGADEATLVCVNKADGKVRWMRSNTYYHAVNDEEKARFKDLEPKVKQLEDVCEALPAIISAAVSTDGSGVEKNDALQKKVREKCGLEAGIRDAMAKVDKKYVAWSNNGGWSTPTPTSDGKFVYGAFGGGDKGLGANTVACYDLDGKRIWSFFCGQTGIGEHGTHCSPALCGNFLLYRTGFQLFGFDKSNGKVLWQIKAGGDQAPSIVPIRIGTVDAAVVPTVGIVRASDGVIIWKAAFRGGISTPVVVDGTIYGTNEEYYSYKLPSAPSDALKVDQVAKVPWKNVGFAMPGTFTNCMIGSPLYDNGLVYAVTEGGGLSVVDAAAAKQVYSKALDILQPRLTWVFVVGICTGPNLAGKYIHIRDDQHQTLVINPGKEFKVVAKSMLQEYSAEGHQPEAQSNPFYEGGRMYYRTRAFLYCIGEK